MLLAMLGAFVSGVGTGSGAWASEELAADELAAAEQYAGDNDPLEPLNRVFFEFNEVLQTWFLRPAGTFYKAFVPPPGQEAIGNAIDNLSTPVVLMNDLLQGEWDRAWVTTERFGINSTYGVAGLIDQAEDMGIPGHDEDFGQTLAVWGVDEMIYLVLPVFGPSNPRDMVGKYVVDPFFDPLGIWLANSGRESAIWMRTAVGAVDEYASVMDELGQVQKTSVDYYAAIRSMYRQKREAEIRNASGVDLPPIPDLTYEFEEDAPASVGELPASAASKTQ